MSISASISAPCSASPSASPSNDGVNYLRKLLSFGNALFLKKGSGIVAGGGGIEAWEDYGTTGKQGTWFDGVGDYVETGILVGASTEMQISFDLVRGDVGALVNQMVIGAFDNSIQGSVDNRCFFVQLEAGGNLRVLTNDTGAGGGSKNYYFTTGITDGDLHSIIITWGAGGTLTLSLDGVLQSGSGSVATALFNSDISIKIGNHGSASVAFNGYLGNVTIEDDGVSHTYLGNGNQDANWEESGPSGAYFDGVDDRVHIVDDATLDISGAITLSAWVYPTDLSEGFEVIMAKGRTASSSGGDMSPYTLTTASSKARFAIGDTTVRKTISSVLTLPLNTLSHVVGTWDGTTGTDNMKIYVDGVEVAKSSQSSVSAISTNGLDLVIGRDDVRSTDSRFRFHGVINKVSVHARALSAEEVTAMYSTGLPPESGMAVNLIGTSSLSAGWADQSSNSNDGTVNGSPARAVQVDSVWREANDGTVSGSPLNAVTTATGWRAAVDFVQGTATNQPADGGGFPEFDGVDNFMASARNQALTGPFVVGFIVDIHTLDSDYQHFFDGADAGGRALSGVKSTTDEWRYYQGDTPVVSAVDATVGRHVIVIVFDGASSEMFVNGVSVASGSGGVILPTDFVLASRYDGADAFFDGGIETFQVLDNPDDIADARDAMIAYLDSVK